MKKKRKSVSSSVIARHYSENKNTKVKIKTLVDWGEPSCWACGFYEFGTSESKNIFTRWNDAKFLEKCHIVPSCLGGDESPDNMFLMCGECHKESPDHADKDSFQQWLNYKSKSSYFHEMHTMKIEKALNVYGINESDCLNFLDDKIIKDRFFEYMKENATVVPGQKNYMTFVAALKGFMKNNEKESEQA